MQIYAWHKTPYFVVFKAFQYKVVVCGASLKFYAVKFLSKILSGVQLFVLKYRVIDREEELKAIHRQILNDSREIHMLKADWALLNDPIRLRALVAQTDFKSIGANQIKEWQDMPLRPAPIPIQRPTENMAEENRETKKQ